MALIDEYPGRKSAAFERYAQLEEKRLAARAGGADAASEHALLAEMNLAWEQLSPSERAWLEYRSFRTAAAEQGDNVERHLAALWSTAEDRARAKAELARYGQEPHEAEAERVRLAVLKLGDRDLPRIAELVQEAKRDPQDLLAQAEHPGERAAAWTRRPELTEDEQERLAVLRAEDERQYWEWIRA
jgi:hypothetical protein